MSTKRSIAFALLAAVLGARESSSAELDAGTRGPQLEDDRPRGLPLDAHGFEKYNAGWTLAFDNDLLSFADRDFDYTGGLAVTFAGRRAKEWALSLDPIVGLLDPLVPVAAVKVPALPLHSLQVGIIAFTPDDLNSHDPLPLDRPYASLLLLSNSRTYVTHPLAPVYETSFTLGVFGLEVAKAIQRGIHTGLDQERVRKDGIIRSPTVESRRCVSSGRANRCWARISNRKQQSTRSSGVAR